MTDQQIQTIILEEVRALRTRFDVHSIDTGERLAKLETHVESLVGNGQPGRLSILEDRVSALQHWKFTTTGIYIGISTVVSAVTAFLYHLWK